MDYARFMGPQIDGASTLFHQLNHNKQCLNIDYNSLAGHQEVLQLIETADVLVEQFRPGAMDAWGLGYEKLREINPNLIYVSMTGYSSAGAYQSEAGHDFNYLAYGGLMSLQKDDTGKPVVPGFQIADIGGAYMAVIAIQSALIKQIRRGKGGCYNVPLAASVSPLLAVPYSIHSGEMSHEQFSMINGKVLVSYAAYQCMDDKWISLAALELKFWNNFCEIVDRPDWKRDSQLALSVHVFDKTDVEALFKTKTRDQWTAMLKGKDVCFAPILEIEELEDADFHKDAETFVEIKTPNGLTLKTIALPFKEIEA